MMPSMFQPNPPDPGLVVAFLWHLGSLAKGASALALLRLLRWLLYLAHAAAAEVDPGATMGKWWSHEETMETDRKPEIKW